VATAAPAATAAPVEPSPSVAPHVDPAPSAPAEIAEPVSEAGELPPEPPISRSLSSRGQTIDDFESTPSSFEHEPPFRPRRNPLKMWTAAAVAFALAIAAMIGAVSWFGLPNWLPVQRPTFGPPRPDLELSFPPGRQDRRTLPNGTEYFGASGTVTNIGKEVRDVPVILIVLRDEKDRIVYKWAVTPPKDKLKPGESVTVNEAVTDVPKSAKFAEISWKPD
jgi:hypothetical protein